MSGTREEQTSSEAQGDQLTFAQIAEQWIKKLVMGGIRYDPATVTSRWMMAPDTSRGRFKSILNEGRVGRSETKAA